jgi:purine-binding chemotaxis protein CheW
VVGLLQRDAGPVPVIDLSAKFGLVTPPGAPRTNVIVTETQVDGAPTLLGLLTTDRSRVVEVDEAAIAAVPEVGSGIRLEFLRGVVSAEGVSAFLLHLERTVSATEVEALEGLTAAHLRQLEEAGVGVQAATTDGSLSVATESEEYVVFVVSDVRLAAALGRLRELLAYGSVVPVPGARAWIRGVTNRRGQVTPVIDAATCLGLPSRSITPRSRILVFDADVEGSPTPVGVAIDDVLDVVALEPQDIEPAPQIGLPIPPGRLRGVARVGGDFVSVLDVGRLLPDANAAVGLPS